jgi:hypothetical protein
MIKCLKVEGSEKWRVKWSEVKIFGVMCVLSWIYSYKVCMWVTVQYVLLSHSLIAICSMSFAFWYVLINCSLFFNCLLCLFSCFVRFASILCVLCFCIVSPHVYSCLFSICVQFSWPLPPGRNPSAVNKYHHTISKFSNHCFSFCIFTVCFLNAYNV